MAWIRRHPAASLYVTGVTIFCVAAYTFQSMRFMLVEFREIPEPFRIALIVLIGALMVAGFSISWPLVPLALGSHRRLVVCFQAAVEIGYSWRKTKIRLLVSGLLNLAYWVLIFFAPWKAVLDVVPGAAVVQAAIPESFSFQEFLNNPWWQLCAYVFFGYGGPMTIYAITWFRFENPTGDKGKTTLNLLGVLCYLSGLLLVLSAFLHFDPSRLMFFANLYFALVLPSTFGCNALILAMEPSFFSRHRVWS